MKYTSKHGFTLFALLAFAGASRRLYAQNALRVSGRSATQGVHDFRPVSAGATEVYTFTTGGTVLSTQALTYGCRGGWITQRPDVILRVRADVPALRVWVTGVREANPATDGRPGPFAGTALVVNSADGHWRCESSYGGGSPQMILTNAGVGQYDLWVGSNMRGATLTGELHVASVPFLETRGDQARAGVRELTADTDPESMDLPLTSRPQGDIDLRMLGDGCLGTAPRQPDLIVRLPTALPLFRVSATTTAESTLVMRTPGDRWRCNDARGGGDPLVMLRDAPAGQYEVWVGSKLGADISGTLHVTRATLVETGATSGVHGMRELLPEFTPATTDIEIAPRPAGTVDARLILTGCQGRIARRPDLVVRIGASMPSLRAYVTSTVDTTLMMHGPDDLWYCDDDSYGSFNPLLDFANLGAGSYELWVGAFNAAQPVSGTLHLTRSPLVEVGGQEATLGIHDLAPNFAPDHMSLEIPQRAGGEIEARQLSRGCQGAVTRRPDAILRVSGSLPLLRTYVTSTPTTTLVMHGPDDTWHCANNAGTIARSNNPLIDLRNVARGQYEVWVGTYGRNTTVTGALHITRNPALHP
jgi:hypothetical protein